jgi:hypothetical protein
MTLADAKSRDNCDLSKVHTDVSFGRVRGSFLFVQIEGKKKMRTNR